jgi:cobalamin synthase
VLIVWGFLSDGSRGRLLLATGLALVTLATLELSIREHFAGYRSHSSLLAGAAAVASAVPLFFLTSLPQELIVLVAVVVGATAFWLLREAFRRRSGGLGFRA